MNWFLANCMKPMGLKSCNNCTAFPKHLHLLKLCMHVHDPKWKLFTKFQEEMNSLINISSILKIECGTNEPQHNRRVKHVWICTHLGNFRGCHLHDPHPAHHMGMENPTSLSGPSRGQSLGWQLHPWLPELQRHEDRLSEQYILACCTEKRQKTLCTIDILFICIYIMTSLCAFWCFLMFLLNYLYCKIVVLWILHRFISL